MAAALANFTRPRMHRALMRERLFEYMDDARQQPMVWVAAPAGSGKTTLLASYLAARKVHSLWYQIDLPGYCRHFFRAFFARLANPAVIVLDNYHELPASSLLHTVIERALAEVPEGISIVVASRTEPPRELVPLKVSGRCATLDGERLRMSFEETSAIAATRSVVVDASTVRSCSDEVRPCATGSRPCRRRCVRMHGSSTGRARPSCASCPPKRGDVWRPPSTSSTSAATSRHSGCCGRSRPHASGRVRQSHAAGQVEDVSRGTVRTFRTATELWEALGSRGLGRARSLAAASGDR